MGTLNIHDADDAVSSMRALREVLADNLEEVLSHLAVVQHLHPADAKDRIEEISVYEMARTSLLSGLASINEVLAWVRLAAAKDAEGNEPDCVKSLPEVPVQRSS